MRKLFIVALLLLSPFSAFATLSTGNTHYWKFSESSGNASDSIGSYTLTNNNTTTYVAGFIGNAANFVAASGQSLTSTTAINGGSAMTAYTANCWFNLASLPGSGVSYDIMSAFPNDGAWQFRYRNTAGTKNLFFRAFDNACSGSGTVTDNVNLSTGAWHMITQSWDGTTMTAYLDGSSINTAGISTICSNNAGDFSIGASDHTGGEAFDGKIDECSVWTRALSGSEITQLYNSGTGCQYPYSSLGSPQCIASATAGAPSIIGLIKSFWLL